ncbi:MAG: hypothetical protein GTO45_11940 [Candidatus Aminicenantes bacterium]|nr:hypothetical protein [Candidatus Aminicenantes bacterium]NIM84025.1 hypothetical protein [Candidatus Aminicenantes bacterium]NIN18803.1 hypothetical protein [Candidatus Aminicenantes bacterium]NIN42725.1 hypothetical protein [Candidatus Aminicenantes bacterium]NIN85459.1 hypothetical protein [Candidatus Aminicenantes bacterium]
MDAKDVYNILKHGNADERKSLVMNCPDDPFKNQVLSLIGSDDPSMVVVSLNMLIMKYCMGAHPAEGAILALAAYTYAVEIYNSHAHHSLEKFTLSNIASAYLKASNALGRSSDVISFADQCIPYFKNMFQAGENNSNIPSLIVEKVRALLNQNEIDEAEKCINDPYALGDWSMDMEVNRLKKKIAIIKGDITTTTKPTGQSGLPVDSLINIMTNAINQTIPDTEKRNELLSLTENLDPTNRIDPYTEKGSKQLKELMDKVESFLNRGSTLK